MVLSRLPGRWIRYQCRCARWQSRPRYWPNSPGRRPGRVARGAFTWVWCYGVSCCRQNSRLQGHDFHKLDRLSRPPAFGASWEKLLLRTLLAGQCLPCRNLDCAGRGVLRFHPFVDLPLTGSETLLSSCTLSGEGSSAAHPHGRASQPSWIWLCCLEAVQMRLKRVSVALGRVLRADWLTLQILRSGSTALCLGVPSFATGSLLTPLLLLLV